jgi:hypothetical protein
MLPRFCLNCESHVGSDSGTGLQSKADSFVQIFQSSGHGRWRGEGSENRVENVRPRKVQSYPPAEGPESLSAAAGFGGA